MGSEAVLLVLLFGKSKYKSDASSVAGIMFKVASQIYQVLLVMIQSV